MSYEVNYGDSVYYVTAGNPWQACLLALDEHLIITDEVEIAPFVVTNLSSDYQTTETIGLSEVLAIRSLSANYEEEMMEV